ncbi:DUF2169 family type VI secretion system accessory protein [Paraburkholderia hayleyella]|uniref:DUF2169 family type VI secretion system accessory protein n=1 Tax=Paraburkholderia hayleyella TaxID=2152889 RepID=UPI00157FE594|nr:DUF2169 domain-containing protein [Paraburkholderia hayleyella]
MKIHKPAETLILLKHGARFGKPCLTVTLGYMAHVDGTLLTEQAAWGALLAQFKSQPFDSGEKKARGVFAVAGEARAPEGHQVLAMTVSARCAGREKTLHVYGERYWRHGLSAALPGWIPGEPKPFATMPLDFAHAYGGPLWRDNPHGLGHRAEGADWARVALPNLELPGSPCLSPADRPLAATYLPLPSDAPARAQWLGALDERWRKTRFPDYPDDTDPRFFDAVAEDQCLDRYFTGDEPFEVMGMHALWPTVGGRLPGLRPRLLWREARLDENGIRREDGPVMESPLDLDTVWLFPNDERVLVLYRTTWRVNELDATDVAALRIYTERLSDTPASSAALVARWREEGAAATAKKMGAAAPAAALKAPAPAAGLPPALRAQQVALREAQAEAVWAGIEQRHQTLMATLMQQPGGIDAVAQIPAPQRAAFDAARMNPPVLSGATSVDVPAKMREIMTQAGVPEVQIEHFLRAPPATPQALTEALEAARAQITAGPLDGAQKGHVLGHLTAFGALAEARAAKWPEALAASGAPGQDAVPNAASAAATAATTAAPAPAVRSARTTLDVAAIVARLAAHQPLTRIHVKQQDLSALNFDGIDLSDSEFIDCNFTRASLQRARLPRSTFAGCTLNEARLDAADLSGTAFTGCDLSAARLAACNGRAMRWTRCQAAGADLSGASLNQASFTECTFDGLRAAQCSATQATWRQCSLLRADFTRANLERSTFAQCAIGHAVFDHARLVKAQWQTVSGNGVQWREANLTNWRVFSQCVFEEGDFTQANLSQACLRNSSLRRACLREARLDGALLLACDLSSSEGYHLSARGAQFTDSRLNHAQWRGANLLGASLRKVQLCDVDLTGANLYSVQTRGAVVSGVKLYQALLTRCRLLEEHSS